MFADIARIFEHVERVLKIHKGAWTMKSFLKKLGSSLFNFLKVGLPEISAVGAIVAPFLGSGTSTVVKDVTTGVNDLTAIGQQVLTIETALQGQPGSAKLTALIPLVGNILKTSELVAGKKIADEATFTKAVQEIAQGAVDMINSLDESAAPSA